MSRPVAIIKTPPEPVEVRIARLGIPKARQKRLRKIMDAAWAQLEDDKAVRHSNANEVKERHLNASAAD